jgi:hypothetical protein
MTEEKKVAKPKKVADPIAASIDPATQEMIVRAQKLGVETVFDRAVTMKPWDRVVFRCPRLGLKAKIPEKGCAVPLPIP